MLTAVFTFVLLHNSSFCQHGYFVGVNASIEKNPHYNPNFSAGISIEKQFCKKTGIEIGVGYRQFQNNFSHEKIDFVFLKNFSILEKFITVSLLSKYHLKHFNIAFGPSADVLVNWKNKSGAGYPYLDYLDRKVYYGLMTKVSKPFAVNKKISIEPEIRYNPIFSPFNLYSDYVRLSDRQYLGLGVTAKYRF